jgi:hypothetical protein
MNQKSIDPNFLNQKWLHSHEEDTAEEMVFRPPTFKFPPSRGRTGFELRPDGTAQVLGIAPTDAPQEHLGSWSIGNEKQLTVHVPALQQTQSMTVLSVSPDRLVVKK